jgi:hypothetical protein
LDARIARTCRRVAIITRNELAFVDPKFAIEQVQLFITGMTMGRIPCAWRKTDQHADPASFRIDCQQLAFNAGRNVRPFRLGPLWSRRRHQRLSAFCRDAGGQTRLQRRARTLLQNFYEKATSCQTPIVGGTEMDAFERMFQRDLSNARAIDRESWRRRPLSQRLLELFELTSFLWRNWL